MSGDEAKARTAGRVMLGLGSFGTLSGLYVPLVDYPGFRDQYSVMKSSQELGTPGVWMVLAGSATLMLAATLLFERVQTRAKLGAVLVLACIQALGSLAVCAIAFTLIWADARDFTYTNNRSHTFVEADFTIAAVMPIISPGLLLAGALWLCLNARRDREVPR
ncbi:hypothetical protein OHB26_31765 [Nocardia sp. NBC_01503]|uniref:hypothetical protein n=1 Tax=Nocardia sp. NBC_01503 TaxID=2975997 RepID=UPI002E7B4137|nr:hypothetical protein [Nocardia sp. NBC_01503]WTL31445.1 hypothetical protein OHB26_31765 [Nocardia sp. NBC_01503]